MDPVNEHSSAVYTATLTDQSGAALAASMLTAVTLTLYDKASDTILNERDGQDVLNANDVTIDENGVLTWAMQPADNVIVNQARKTPEVHVALWMFAWATGHYHHAAEIEVVPLKRVP
jgi:hypothetical protein